MMRAVWGVSILALLTGYAVAQDAAAPVVGRTAATPGMQYPLLEAKLEEAAALAQTGNWSQALAVYTPMVNAEDTTLRGQARFGLAVALSQLGREAEALKALEGTSADESELGQAVGALRGNLVLQLAEKSLMETGGSGPYLNDYDRLLQKPNPLRAQRLRALEEPGTEPAVVRVGVLVPLSGPLEAVGREIIQGFQLALTTAPSWRGTTLELIPADTTPGPEAAFDSVVSQGAQLVVGPLLSKQVGEIAGRAQAANITLLTLSSDADVASAHVHILPPLPTEQASKVAAWAMATGKTTAAALVPNTPYGTDMLAAFRTTYERQGGQIITTSFFNTANVDLGASVRQLAGGQAISGTAPFDALFMPIPAAAVPMASSQLAYYNFDRAGVQALGTGLWQDNTLLGPATRTLKGSVFAAPATSARFIQQFTEAFGKAPQGMGVQGYDAGRLVLQLAAEHHWSGREMALLLNRPEGFYGTGGYYKFQANGLTQRGIDLVKLDEGAFHVLQPALTLAPLPVPANLRPSARKDWNGWW